MTTKLLLAAGSIGLAACQGNYSSSGATAPPVAGRLHQLAGTWVRADKPATGVLRIRPDSTGDFTYYPAAGPRAGALPDTSHGFTSREPLQVVYRPRAPTGVRYIPNLEVQLFTNDVRLDYELRGDTLLEYDKMGLQARWVRVGQYSSSPANQTQPYGNPL